MFSNTLRLESTSVLVSVDELVASVSTNNMAIVRENEAAANDIKLEEHLPCLLEEDEVEDDPLAAFKTEDTDEQRQVGVSDVKSDEEPTTYARREEAAKRRIVALLGQKVTMQRGRTESLECFVVDKSNPENFEVTKESVGLATYGKLIGDAQPGTFLAQLCYL
jgi:hypothetical protein